MARAPLRVYSLGETHRPPAVTPARPRANRRDSAPAHTLADTLWREVASSYSISYSSRAADRDLSGLVETLNRRQVSEAVLNTGCIRCASSLKIGSLSPLSFH